MKWLFPVGLLALICSSGVAAMTPAIMCKKAGFVAGHPFKEECVKRVFRERRSNFWRNEAPKLLAGGLVAGVAASGGTAVGFFSTRPDPSVYKINVQDRDFLVKIEGAEATVRSARKYENVGKQEELWASAARNATGCSTARRVKDFDALYVWLDCGVSQPATPAAVQISGQPHSLADELGKLASLRERGLLTDAEYDAAKAKLLKD